MTQIVHPGCKPLVSAGTIKAVQRVHAQQEALDELEAQARTEQAQEEAHSAWCLKLEEVGKVLQEHVNSHVNTVGAGGMVAVLSMLLLEVLMHLHNTDAQQECINELQRALRARQELATMQCLRDLKATFVEPTVA